MQARPSRPLVHAVPPRQSCGCGQVKHWSLYKYVPRPQQAETPSERLTIPGGHGLHALIEVWSVKLLYVFFGHFFAIVDVLLGQYVPFGQDFVHTGSFPPGE